MQFNKNNLFLIRNFKKIPIKSILAKKYILANVQNTLKFHFIE